MKQSEKFDRVKRYYDSGRWTAQMVRNAVTAPIPWITSGEAEEILGGKSDEHRVN